jgi:hypothetical protein
MKWILKGYMAFVAATLCFMAYAFTGREITLGKIKETCHIALAFKDPTPTAQAICFRNGFYK